MNNEDKSIEIAERSKYLSDFRHDEQSEFHGSMEMAKWKDEQLKEKIKVLEKTIAEEVEWQKKDRNHDYESQDAYIGGLQKALEIITKS